MFFTELFIFLFVIGHRNPHSHTQAFFVQKFRLSLLDLDVDQLRVL